MVTQTWFHRLDPIGACPPTTASAAPDGAPLPPRSACQRWTLVVVCVASALLLFGVTAPNVALPDMGRTLGAGFADLQWVLSGYALVLAALVLAGGALGDRYGRRLLFLAGLTVFAAGSVCCALAPSAGALIAGRVVQGVGAAAVFPAGLALIGTEFGGQARARAIGVWGASVAAAVALGPLVGGVLVELMGWRGIFGASALAALPATAVAVRHLRESRGGHGALDVAGTALLSGALFVAVLVLTRANTWGWSSPPVLLGGVGALVLVGAFWAVEHRVAHPLVAPELLRNPAFGAATAVALIVAAAGFAPLVYVTQYLLTVAGSGPALAGLQVAPFAVAGFVVSLGAASVAARMGARTTLAVGLVLCAAGLGLLQLLGPPASFLRLLPGLVVFGTGVGLVNPTMTVVALGAVPPDRAGMASGVNNAARQFGIAAGIAGFGAVVQAVLDGRGAATGPGARAAAYAEALELVFLLGAGAAAVGVAVVLGLVPAAGGRAVR